MKISQDKPLDPSYTVILFYKYTPIKELDRCLNWQRGIGRKYNLTGRVRLASEGINATLEGKNEDIEKYINEIRTDLKYHDLHDVEIKTSVGTGFAFQKLSVKIVSEIVKLGLGTEDVDPNQLTGVHLKPAELREWYENNDDFVVIDMRNDYEFKVGHFKNSINPPITNFREIADVLPDIVAENPGIENKKVLTVCTGGVRCEKASGYLLKKGFKEVYQLDGGMHKYMEEFPGKDFRGGLFTFDNRVVMDFTKDREVIGVCDMCNGKTERFDNCINDECHVHMMVCQECRDKNNFIWCSDKCRETGRMGKVRFRDIIDIIQV
jgi:UPF0176 protein